MVIVVTVIIGIFALVGWLSHIRHQRYQVAVRAKTERFNKIIDRFGNEKSFVEFLQSEKGLPALTALTASTTSAKVPILVMICSGIIALAFGAGALVLTLVKDDDLIFPTVFMSAIGLGLFIAAAISYTLSRKWGIFEENTSTAWLSLPATSQPEQTAA